MILGNDISKFQGSVNFDIYKNNSNFVIAKASEGVGYIDSWFGNNRTQARRVGLPFGSYHFARPDLGNYPQSEASFYCNLIDGDPIREGETLCLDFEVAFNDPVGWSKQWLDIVSNHFNCKPFVYLNQALTKKYDWSPVVNADYPLWIAAYTFDPKNNNFSTGDWPSATMQQWTNKQQVPGITGSVDGNVFFGDVNAFKACGYKLPVSPPLPPSIPAPQMPPTPQPEKPIDPRIAEELGKMTRRIDTMQKTLDLLYKDRELLETIQGKITDLDEQIKLSREHDRTISQDIKAEVNVTSDEVKEKVAEVKKVIENKKVIRVVVKSWWTNLLNKIRK